MNGPERRVRDGAFTRAAVSMLLAMAVASAAEALDPSKAVTQYALDRWSTDDGLPQITVQHITQTREGYLWLGTQDGMARFDGVRFTVYSKRSIPAILSNSFGDIAEASNGDLWAATTDGGLVRIRNGSFRAFTDQDGLSSTVVYSVYQDSSGTLWAATDAGVNRYRDGRFEPLPASIGLTDVPVNTIMEDSRGRLWFGTFGHGLCRLADGLARCLDEDEGLVTSAIYDLAEGNDGSLWIGAENGGLYRLRDGVIEHFGPEQGLRTSHVFSVLVDRDDNLWVGTYDLGLVRYRNGVFERYGIDEGLGANRVAALYEDLEGSLWVGTFTAGLVQLRDASFTVVGTRQGLSSDHVWSVLEDRKGRIWAGCMPGLNMLVDGKPVPFPGDEELADVQVNALFEDRDGRLWLGTARDGVKRYEDGSWISYTAADGLASNHTFGMTQDSQGAIWVATRAGLSRILDGVVESYHVADGLPIDSVRVVHVDRQGVLWIGTRGGGIARMHNGQLTAFDPGFELTPTQLVVMNITEGSDGSLWFGTAGGLLRHQDGRTHVFTIHDGLFDEYIHRVLEDQQGYLWMSTNRGIFRVAKSELDDVVAGRREQVTCTVYGRPDGMLNEECNGGCTPAGWRARDGRLWFPTVAGLVSIDPAGLRINPPSPAGTDRGGQGRRRRARSRRADRAATGEPAMRDRVHGADLPRSRAGPVPLPARRAGPRLGPRRDTPDDLPHHLAAGGLHLPGHGLQRRRRVQRGRGLADADPTSALLRDSAVLHRLHRGVDPADGGVLRHQVAGGGPARAGAACRSGRPDPRATRAGRRAQGSDADRPLDRPAQPPVPVRDDHAGDGGARGASRSAARRRGRPHH